MRALEEQVRQGKLRKEEEKKRRATEQKAAKERDVRLAAQREEVEAAKERERQLQLQLLIVFSLQELPGNSVDFAFVDAGQLRPVSKQLALF